MGLCDKSTGLCTCRNGFYGDSCDKMACGGGVDTPCNGHGRCMNMYELALWAEYNGDHIDISYGKDPNNPYTWDGYRTHGCKCDKGYHGYDCTLRDCPTGDDAGTYDDHVEVQAFTCLADTGTFTLSFRQYTTDPIPYYATRDMIETALEKLPSIAGDVDVYFTRDNLPPDRVMQFKKPTKTQSIDGMPTWGHFDANGVFVNNAPTPATYPGGAPVCFLNSLETNLVIVSFATVHNDLPSMTAGVSDLSIGGDPETGKILFYTDGQQVAAVDRLGATHTFTTIKGTTETAVCNNRGLCEEATGVCECFPDWTSSNGRGGPGTKKDCGYRNDLKNSWFNSEKGDNVNMGNVYKNFGEEAQP
jgi:hypothetical protein